MRRLQGARRPAGLRLLQHAAGVPRRLTTQADHFELYPSVSRDGQRVVFTTWDDDAFGSVRVLDLTEGGDGVRIFIGSENKLFSLSGSSLVVSPYMNSDRKIIGAVGVIGPTRLNYGRIVPIVDYTAQLVGRALSGLKG